MRRPHDHLCIRRRNEHAGPLIHIVLHLSYSFIHGDGIYCYSQDLYLIGHTVPSSNFINTHIELVYYKKKGASMYDAPPHSISQETLLVFRLILFFLDSRTDGQLTELLIINRRRCIRHHIACTLILRESNDVADGCALGHKHNQTI